MKHIKLFEQNWWENCTDFGEECLPEHELKSGDKVEILDNFEGGHLKIGSIGRVDKVFKSGVITSYQVYGTSEDDYVRPYSAWSYYRSSLKKVE